MFRNYLKIVFRSLLKNKGYSVLNIFGLAIGIICASLIFLWVEDEVNFNSHFENIDRVYGTYTNQDYNGEIYTFNSTPGLFSPTIKDEVPGIEYATRYNEEKRLVSLGDNSAYQKGLFVDDDFYDILSLQFVEGNFENLKNDISGIVVTQKMALQYFGSDQNIVGRTLKFDNQKEHTIRGVVANFPDNVSIKFDWLGTYKAYEQGKDFLKNWQSNSTSTIVQLAENANVTTVGKAIKKVIPENANNEGKIYAILYNMNDWRLTKFDNGIMVDGRFTYVRLFSIIAFIILIIACINFMNLATARSQKRANEVGVRKVLGSKRIHLMSQFFLESLVLTTIAAVISILFIYLLLPSFNTIIGKELVVGISNPLHIFALLAVVVFCSFLSGLYPALYLSSFRPATVLKGTTAKGSSTLVRNGLVITQFAASIALIVSTIVVYSQIQHVKNRDIGYNKSNLVSISLKGDALKNYDAIKQQMLNTGFIEKTGLNSFNVLYGGYNGSGFEWEGKEEKFDPLISFRSIDHEFIPTVGMTIKEGRNFYKKPNLESIEVIITESLAKMMGEDTAVGKIIRRGDDVHEVVGVVKDFVYGNMYSKSDPVIFYNFPQQASLIYARIKEGVPTETAIATLSNIIKKNNPAFPFEYRFVEDTFNAKFKSEMLVEKLSQWFAVLAIIISCFGLFGLAAYMAEQRSKEIGVRKVLGASAYSIVNLLSRDFLKLVVLSIAIASPLAWLFMTNWLEEFKYRIEVSWWMFATAGLLAIAIALFTVSFQAIKASVANPVKSLRTE